MTKEESKEYIEFVLRGIWPRWIPTDFQIEVWIHSLKDFDYEISRAAIRNWSMRQERIYSEPNIAQIRNILLKEKAKIFGKKINEPVHLYTIVKEKFIENDRFGLVGERFYAGNMAIVPDEHEIEKRAERDRQTKNKMTGENHVIKYIDIKREKSKKEMETAVV